MSHRVRTCMGVPLRGPVRCRSEHAKDLEDPRHPISYERLQYYANQSIAHWRELSKQIGPEMADILATASDEQLAELFQNIDKRNEKFKSNYVDIPLESLAEKRKERLTKDIKQGISRLTAEQKQAVSDWSDQITPLEADGLRYRERVLTEFQNLLTKRRQAPDFKEVATKRSQPVFATRFCLPRQRPG